MSRLTPEKLPEFWGALADKAERAHARSQYFRRKQALAMAEKIKRELKRELRQERKAKRSA